MRSQVTQIDIPDNYNILAAYPIAVLKPRRNPISQPNSWTMCSRLMGKRF
jgi:hypothetical protein